MNDDTISVSAIFLTATGPYLPPQPASTTCKQHAHPSWPQPPNMADDRMQSVLSWLSTVPPAAMPTFRTATAEATQWVFSLCPTVGGFVFAPEFPCASSPQRPRRAVDPQKHRGKKTCGRFDSWWTQHTRQSTGIFSRHCGFSFKHEHHPI